MLEIAGTCRRQADCAPGCGGFGVGHVEKICRGLLDIEVPLEIVVVTGHNEKAGRKLEEIETPSHHHHKVLGFTDKIHKLMAVANVVVSKPGGLTTSEGLASRAAMAIVNPVPGQKSRNSDFLLENGTAINLLTFGGHYIKIAF